MHATLPLLEVTDFPPLKRKTLEILQVNLGYLCNQQCLHCHVNAGPKRKENMDEKTVHQVIDYLKKANVKTLDLTGGAPEMNPHFQLIVQEARKLNIKVIDRCNLTILSEPGQENLANFLAENSVEVVASLPCYLEENVDAQRGKGVFDNSLIGLEKLNKLGYGKENSGLTLNLVYNPQGATLPPAQKELEASYKKILKEKFDVSFNQLFTITNMPIKRFGSMLISKGKFKSYMQLLRDNYSAENLQGVMCLNTISVDYNGELFDCDFNQMLGLPLKSKNKIMHISHLLEEEIEGKSVLIADHCYGCTAGQGSSCGGAIE